MSITASSSRLGKVAEILAADLSSQDWVIDFSAERAWTDRTATKDLNNLKVLVMPTDTETSRINRGWSLQEHTLNIVFKKKVTADGDPVESIIALVEDVKNYLTSNLESGTGSKRLKNSEVYVQAVTWPTIMSPESLEEDQIFLSILEVVAEEMRANESIDEQDNTDIDVDSPTTSEAVAHSGSIVMSGTQNITIASSEAVAYSGSVVMSGTQNITIA